MIADPAKKLPVVVAPPAPISEAAHPSVVQLSCPPPAAAPQLPWMVTWVLPFIPLALTIFGWWIVGRQADRRERRKDIRDLIGETRKRVNNVESAVATYCHTSTKDVKSGLLAAQIKAEILALTPLIQSANGAGLKFDRWDLVAALRQQATGGDFETATRQTGVSERALLVATAATDLTVALDDAYFQAFPIKV